MAMESRDKYVNRIVRAAMELFDKGIRDPSVSEIACSIFPAPFPDDPLAQPAELGGEIYNGVLKRLPIVRRELEDVHGLQCALVTAMYYRLGGRNRSVDDGDEASMCMPSGNGNKAIGLFLVKPEDGGNLVYQAWLNFNGKPGGSRTKRVLEQAKKAYESGALPAPDAIAITGIVQDHLKVTPIEIAKGIRDAEDERHKRGLPSA